MGLTLQTVSSNVDPFISSSSEGSIYYVHVWAAISQTGWGSVSNYSQEDTTTADGHTHQYDKYRPQIGRALLTLETTGLAQQAFDTARLIYEDAYTLYVQTSLLWIAGTDNYDLRVTIDYSKIYGSPGDLYISDADAYIVKLT